MYDNDNYVSPVIRDFWTNIRNADSDFHIFKNNRNMVFFGDSLSRNSFKYIADRMEKNNINFDMHKIAMSFFKMMQFENGNTEQLKNLAVKAVSEAFDVPEDLLDANLNEDANVELNNSENKHNFKYEELSQYVKNQINKRILLNCIIQGSSIHSFYTMHYIVKDEIEQIAPELIGLYDEFALGSVRSYYLFDYSSMVGGNNVGAIGSAKVEFDDDDNPKVVANARSFPVLCQELVKGSMETICMHGLEGISKEDLQKIYHFADAIKDEPRYIQIGSHVWRNVLELRKKLQIGIPELVMKIALLEVNEIEDLFENLLDEDYEKVLETIGEENA
jgi:hypothetical protein